MSVSPMGRQSYEPPSMKAARRVGRNSLVFRLERATVDDQRGSESGDKSLTAEPKHKAHTRRFKSENPASPGQVDESEPQTLASLAAVQMLDSCWTLPVECIPTEWAGSPLPPKGYTSSGEPVPVMISTLTMHVKYGRSTNMPDSNSWWPRAGRRRPSEPWRSVWRSGYDGPWSSASDWSGARNSLDKAPEPYDRSRSSVDDRSSNSATERLRRLRLRARGRYRRALNVSEASPSDSALLSGTAAAELDRVDEIEDEAMVDEDRSPIPHITCPRSAPAILLSQNTPNPESFIEDRLKMPPRSLSSQSYRGLPIYTTRKEVVADRIRSLGRILRQSDSSSHSTAASEFPTPLDARERRRRARDLYDLHSESVSPSPLFNSPASESVLSLNTTSRGIFDPLVRAGTLLAAAELDRLSSLAHSRRIDSRTSDKEPTVANAGTSSVGDAPTNRPASHLGGYGAVASPLPPTTGTSTPAVPTNTPSSDLAAPIPLGVSHSVRFAGHRRRGAHSRLSEIYDPEDAQDWDESGSESGSVIAAARDRSSPDETSVKEGDACEQTEIHRGLVPKPLVLSPSPPREGTERKEPSRTAQLDGPSSKRLAQKKLDMDHLNELIDKAISNSLVTQRLNALSPPPPHPAGALFLGIHTSRLSIGSQLKQLHHETCETRQILPLGSSLRPIATSRASSPGPRRDRSTIDQSSFSAASPVVRKHMARHVSGMATPTESHAVRSRPDGRNSDGGDEAEHHARRSEEQVGGDTSESLHEMEAVESSEGSLGGSHSSDGESPLADDGCPQEFAKAREPPKQVHGITPGTLPEERDSVNV